MKRRKKNKFKTRKADCLIKTKTGTRKERKEKRKERKRKRHNAKTEKLEEIEYRIKTKTGGW